MPASSVTFICVSRESRCCRKSRLTSEGFRILAMAQRSRMMYTSSDLKSCSMM